MKKSILFSTIIISIFIVGCSMNSKNSNESNTLNNTVSINSSIENVHSTLGKPKSSIYYVDTSNLDSNNLDKLTLDNIKNRVIVLSSYKVDDKDTYKHIYFENGKATNIIEGNYSLKNSKEFNTDKAINSEFKIEVFNNEGIICKDDFSINYAKESLIDNDISKFNKIYNITNPFIVASSMNNSDKVYFYPLVDHKVHPNKEHKYPSYQSNTDVKLDIVNPTNNNISTTNNANNKNLGDYSVSALLIYVKDNKIKSMEIVDNNFLLDYLNKTSAK